MSAISLSGRNAVVTGSSTGIGRAIAIRLAERGANVVLHGRSEAAAIRETEELLEPYGVSVRCLFADFNEASSESSFVDAAWNAFDGVDIWVNNAGGDVLTGSEARLSLSNKLDYLFNVDVKATLLLSREIGERMRTAIKSASAPAGDAAIVNIGWDQAWQGMAGESGELFATTKGSVMAMTKSLAQSLAPEVRVNCVAPGWIKTAWGLGASEEWSVRAVRESLMNRWGEPSDVAEAVAFLASPAASFISGQIISVNGGFRSSNP